MHWPAVSFMQRSTSFRKSLASQMTCFVPVVDGDESVEPCLLGSSHLLAHLLFTSLMSGALVLFIWRLSGPRGETLLSSFLDLCFQGWLQAGAPSFVFDASVKPGPGSALFTTVSPGLSPTCDCCVSVTWQKEHMSSRWLTTVSSW